eukprot:RCo018949
MSKIEKSAAVVDQSPLIFVKHGADQTSVFNSNCSNIVLLSFIRKSCGCDASVKQVDLIPSNLGDKALAPLGLFTRPTSPAKEELQPRGTYILLQVKEDEPGVRTFLPLLDSEDGRKLRSMIEGKVFDTVKKPGKEPAKGVKKK